MSKFVENLLNYRANIARERCQQEIFALLCAVCRIMSKIYQNSMRFLIAYENTLRPTKKRSYDREIRTAEGHKFTVTYIAGIAI